MKRWVAQTENKKWMGETDLTIILKEIDTNQIAIRASNVFPVSYRMLAKVHICN